MTPQERELLEGLFSRIRTASPGPRDAEADAFIAEQMRQSPHAAYVLTQAVIVQEEALKGAAARIEELDARIADLERSAQTARQDAPSSFLGGFGKSLLGGGQPEARPTPARGSVPSAGSAAAFSSQDGGPARAPSPGGIGMPNVPPPGGRWTQQGQPIGQRMAPEGQQQQGRGSFLQGALGAAAGVAGGMLLANSLSGLFKDPNAGAASANAGDKAPAAASDQSAAQTASAQQPWGSTAEQDARSAAADEEFGADPGWDAQLDDFDTDAGDAGGWQEDI